LIETPVRRPDGFGRHKVNSEAAAERLRSRSVSDADLVDEQLRLLMRAAQAGDSDAYRALLTALTPRIGASGVPGAVFWASPMWMTWT
jgi:hypothetical protein